jgi:hypothetical protein
MPAFVDLAFVRDAADVNRVRQIRDTPPRFEGTPTSDGHQFDPCIATARRCPSPGERQYPVLALGDAGLAQKDFDSRRAGRGALDGVPHILLGRRVPSQTASWFALRDRLVAAADAVVDVTAVDRACPTRQMRPDRARNPVFDL